MAVITTGSHPKALWPGVYKFWGTTYERFEPIWPKLFEKRDSEKAYEEAVEAVGFGLMSVKAQGAALTYDTAQQGPTSRFTHRTYSLGFMVTLEELINNLYEEVSFKRASRLAKSVYETEEVVHANVFNRAFNSTFTGGDGVEMISTAHPTASGNQSNELTVAADISEASIEDLSVQIRNTTDARGLRTLNKPRMLIVPPALEPDAYRILKSVLQNDSANNAVNYIKASGMFPEGILCNPYLTDTDAWFIKTDCQDGLIHFTRMAATYEQDNDFDTKNAKSAVVCMWSEGWMDWRQCFGSSGA